MGRALGCAWGDGVLEASPLRPGGGGDCPSVSPGTSAHAPATHGLSQLRAAGRDSMSHVCGQLGDMNLTQGSMSIWGRMKHGQSDAGLRELDSPKGQATVAEASGTRLFCGWSQTSPLSSGHPEAMGSGARQRPCLVLLRSAPEFQTKSQLGSVGRVSELPVPSACGARGISITCQDVHLSV